MASKARRVGEWVWSSSRATSSIHVMLPRAREFYNLPEKEL